MKIGDVVRPTPGNSLRCSTIVYDHAIVVSVDPFVLSSEEGDMLWNTKKPEDVHVIGEATLEMMVGPVRRMIEEEDKPIPGYRLEEESVQVDEDLERLKNLLQYTGGIASVKQASDIVDRLIRVSTSVPKSKLKWWKRTVVKTNV